MKPSLPPTASVDSALAGSDMASSGSWTSTGKNGRATTRPTNSSAEIATEYNGVLVRHSSGVQNALFGDLQQ